MPTVLHVRAFRDNYVWLVRHDVRPHVAIVDPGDAGPVIEFLEQQRLVPTAVLCTHHHNDHVGGAATLHRRYRVPVYGPAGDTIAAVTHPVRDGETIAVADLDITFRVLAIPGHTLDHIAYLNERLLFCGDTLFSVGCGRLFEGTAEQLYRSLTRLAELPDQTEVYCGHEYTLSNLRFALTVDPKNEAALMYREAAEAQLVRGEPSLPSTIGREKQLNPFLRVGEPTVRSAIERHAGKRLEDDVSAFAALRRWKDDFRG